MSIDRRGQNTELGGNSIVRVLGENEKAVKDTEKE